MLSVLLLAVTPLVRLPAQDSGGATPLAERVARDARLTFNADAAERASAALAAGPKDLEERAAALLALGGRPGGDLAPLESALADGKPLERHAALFAFGEMGAGGLGALERALAADTGGLEEPLCIALLAAERRGASAARARLATLAQGDTAFARTAQRALARGLDAGPDDGAWRAALEEYLALRWRAARAFGLVDGQRGSKALAAQLFGDAAFRERVVLGASGELAPAELGAHLFELLPEERPEVLRAAAVTLPAALVAAHEAGQWQPSLAAWHEVLAAIDAERAERRAPGLLEIAFRTAPELESEAGLLLVRAGGDLPWKWVADQLDKGTPALRSALAEACGDRGEKARIPELSDLLERRPELGIAGEVLVALARLGHPPAREKLAELVKGPASPERDQVALALARVLHDPLVRPRADELLRREDLAPEQRLELQIGLAAAGAAVDHAPLRTALAAEPSGARRLGIVRALAMEPEPADLEALATLFPVEDDPELDVALACALVRQRHPSLLALLRTSLWNDAWNVSVLAGGLIARVNARALIDELETPPRTAGEADLRRVGFALGEWGGLGAVDELARSRSEGDPALQGALFGALFNRAAEPASAATIRAPSKLDLAPPPSFPDAGTEKGGKQPGPKGHAGGGPKKHRRRHP